MLIVNKKVIKVINWLGGYDGLIKSVRIGKDITFFLDGYISYLEEDEKGYGGTVLIDLVEMGYWTYLKTTVSLLYVWAKEGRK